MLCDANVTVFSGLPPPFGLGVRRCPLGSVTVKVEVRAQPWGD